MVQSSQHFFPEGMIKFVLMVNKQGQTRLAQYYDFLSVKERVSMEGELIRKCLARNESQCSFLEYRGYKVCCHLVSLKVWYRSYIADMRPFISLSELGMNNRRMKSPTLSSFIHW
jgi:hypothetical protein